RPGDHARGDGALEAAISIAAQHADIARAVGNLTLVQDHDVRLAVVVEVPRHHGFWLKTHRERDRGRKAETEQGAILARFQGKSAPRPTGARQSTPGNSAALAKQSRQDHEYTFLRKGRQIRNPSEQLGTAPPTRGRVSLVTLNTIGSKNVH